jgi:predicted O-methyltransferase YrrM
MPTIVTPIERALWWSKQPVFYGEFVRRMSARLARRRPVLWDELGQRTAREWCSCRAISSNEALAALGRAEAATIEDAHATALIEAQQRAKRCSIPMGGPADLNLLFQAAESLAATNVVETGVALGWSSLALLLSVNHRGGRVASVDFPYVIRGSSSCVGVCVPPALKANWDLVRLPDRDGLPKVLGRVGTVDMCHYDSAKSSVARRWAFPLLWQSLRPGGLFISDDIGDNMVFAEFATLVCCDPMVVLTPQGDGSAKYAGVLRVPGTPL